jgi:iron complex transport system substrate-binding protein
VTDSTGAEVIVTSAERIVPVDGDLAEVVYALGSGPLGDLPARGGVSALIWYQRSLVPEPVVAFRPTVVLANTLAGSSGAIDQIQALAPTLVLDYPDTVDGPPEKVRAAGRPASPRG